MKVGIILKTPRRKKKRYRYEDSTRNESLKRRCFIILGCVRRLPWFLRSFLGHMHFLLLPYAEYAFLKFFSGAGRVGTR